MSELSDLRERVSNLEVTVARLEEGQVGVKSAVESLTTRLEPLIKTVTQAKAYLAGAAVAIAIVSQGTRDIADWVTKLFK